MFGIGTSEFLVIIVVAVLVLGPEHLPRIMRTVTKVMSDIRRVSTDFQRTINLEANQEEWRQKQAAVKPAKKKKKIKPKPSPEAKGEPEKTSFGAAPGLTPDAPPPASSPQAGAGSEEETTDRAAQAAAPPLAADAREKGGTP